MLSSFLKLLILRANMIIPPINVKVVPARMLSTTMSDFLFDFNSSSTDLKAGTNTCFQKLSLRYHPVLTGIVFPFSNPACKFISILNRKLLDPTKRKKISHFDIIFPSDM